jgi:hypothetical protein
MNDERKHKTRKKKGGNTREFERAKIKLKQSLENTKPDDKYKLYTNTLLTRLKKLKQNTFKQFVVAIDENMKDILKTQISKQKGGAPTDAIRSRNQPLFRCPICFDDFEIDGRRGRQFAPENAEQCDGPCDNWFHTNCIDTLVDARIQQDNINTYECPVNCGGIFNRNIQAFDQFDNINEWVHDQRNFREEGRNRDRIDRVVNALYFCLILLCILIQVRGVVTRGRFGLIDSTIFFSYLLPQLRFGLTPDQVVEVRNFILRVLAWFENMADEDRARIFPMANLEGGHKKKKRKKTKKKKRKKTKKKKHKKTKKRKKKHKKTNKK